jgi:hypothetical protein
VIQSSPFLGVVSRFTDSKPDTRFIIKNVMQEMNGVLTTPDSAVPFNQQGERADTLYSHCAEPRIFNIFLSSIQLIVDECRGQWENPLPSKDELHVDNCHEFSRVWSAIRFAFSMPVEQANVEGHSNRELFGEGPLFAGCMLLHMLDESRRFMSFDFVRFLNSAVAVEKKSVQGHNVKSTGKFVIALRSHI